MGDSSCPANGPQILGAAAVNTTIYAVGGEALVARVGEPFTYQITATNNPTSYNASLLPEASTLTPGEASFPVFRRLFLIARL